MLPSSAAAVQLDRWPSETLPAYRAAASQLSDARACVEESLAAAAALRRAASDFAAAAARFTDATARAAPDALPAASTSDASVSGGPSSFSAALDATAGAAAARLEALVERAVAPALRAAASSQDAMALALASRTDAANAGESLGVLGYNSRPDALAKGAHLSHAHQRASLLFAFKQQEAIASVSAAVETVRDAFAHFLGAEAAAQAGAVERIAIDAHKRLESLVAALPMLPDLESIPTKNGGSVDDAGDSAAEDSGPSGEGGGGGGDGVSSPRATPAMRPPPASPGRTTAEAVGRMAPPNLLPGERILTTIAGVRNERSGVLGVLVCTNFRLLWCSPSPPPADDDVIASPPVSPHAVSVPLASVARVEFCRGAASAAAPASFQLVVLTSDARVVVLSSKDTLYEPVMDVAAKLLWARVPGFAFEHAFTRDADAPDGWTLHSVDALNADVARMAFFSPASAATGAAPPFHISQVNKAWGASDTYPEFFLAPTCVDADVISASLRFRSRGRLPAVVWFSGAVSLSRASQPRTGILGARSAEDERLLAALGAAIPGAAATGLFIMDARPRLNAVANRASGGGVEKDSHYQGAKLFYLNIDNIHIVRKALLELKANVLRDARDALQRALQNGEIDSFTHPDFDAADNDGDVEIGGAAGAASPRPASLRDGALGSASTPRPSRTPSDAPDWSASSAQKGKLGGKNHFKSFVKGVRKLVTGSSGTPKLRVNMSDTSENAGATALMSPRVSRSLSVADAAAMDAAANSGSSALGGVDASAGGGVSRTPSLSSSAQPAAGAAAVSSSSSSALPRALKDVEWYKLLGALLAGSVKVVTAIVGGVSVLVHCSDGWDRTSALSSLALLQLDPHYRTMRGFCYLIAREWCAFGHKFGRRCGTGTHDADRADAADDQRAPIFLQFLDAVWQLTVQFPTAFEFDARLLAFLAHHAYSGAFGTFLLDCERERVITLFETPSIWSYVLSPRNARFFSNADFVRVALPTPAELAEGAPILPARSVTLVPSVEPASLQVWPYWLAIWDGN